MFVYSQLGIHHHLYLNICLHQIHCHCYHRPIGFPLIHYQMPYLFSLLQNFVMMGWWWGGGNQSFNSFIKSTLSERSPRWRYVDAMGLTCCTMSGISCFSCVVQNGGMENMVIKQKMQEKTNNSIYFI